jgi:hypothetical protein
VAVGDFAFDEDIGEVADEQVTDGEGELGDGEDAAFGAEVELELAHGEVTRDSWSAAFVGVEEGLGSIVPGAIWRAKPARNSADCFRL